MKARSSEFKRCKRTPLVLEFLETGKVRLGCKVYDESRGRMRLKNSMGCYTTGRDFDEKEKYESGGEINDVIL